MASFASSATTCGARKLFLAVFLLFTDSIRSWKPGPTVVHGVFLFYKSAGTEWGEGFRKLEIMEKCLIKIFVKMAASSRLTE